MSNILEQASLVLVPSGYKESKIYSQIPIDGDGDLQFTRASDATRVNSAGLIEKPRTNLFTYSEDFSNSDWTKTRSSANLESVLNPGNTLTTYYFKENDENSSHEIFQGSKTINAGSLVSLSIFFKRKTGSADRFVRLQITDNTFADGGRALFDIQNGTIALSPLNFGAGTEASAKVEAFANGWYRASLTTKINNASTLARSNVYLQEIGTGYSASYLGDNISGCYIWGAQLEEGVSATEYIPTTTSIRTKFAGITQDGASAPNVPRLDYLGSSCPSLLLEPQRTNLITFSEQFDNASWGKSNLNTTGTPPFVNVATAPDGTSSADKFIPNTTNNTHVLSKSGLASNAYTFSIFAKADGESTFSMWLLNNSVRGVFDLSNGTITASSVTSSKIEDYGNGWYRCSVYSSTAGTTASIYGRTGGAFVGDGTSGILFWGAQIELGAYPTSYIPTLGTSVTRVADAASKTGISSLIGQTEGTLYCEFNIGTDTFDGDLISVNNGSISNGFFVSFRSSKVVQLIVRTSSTNVLIFQRVGAYPIGTNKIAVAYKNGDFAISLNGTAAQVNTSTITMPTGISVVELSVARLYTSPIPIAQAQAALFPTRLSNTELAQITTL